MLRKVILIGFLVCLLTPFSVIADTEEVLDSGDSVNKLIFDNPIPPPRSDPPDTPPRRHEQRPPESRPAPPTPPPVSAPVPSAPRGGDDAHYIQPDDYFIAKENLGTRSYIYVSLSKMVTAPSSNSKDEGEFMKINDGQNLWTSHIWQSRIASKDELRLGMHFIAFHDNVQKGVYSAPNKKDRARGGAWWYAKITDMSDVYKGFVTVSGNYKVSLNNIRIPIPYASLGR